MTKSPIDERDPLSVFRLDGRVAFLSGASGWLGRPMAKALAFAGAHVVLNGRREDVLEGYVDELRRAGLSVSAACFDVTDEAAVRGTSIELASNTGAWTYWSTTQARGDRVRLRVQRRPTSISSIA